MHLKIAILQIGIQFSTLINLHFYTFLYTFRSFAHYYPLTRSTSFVNITFMYSLNAKMLLEGEQCDFRIVKISRHHIYTSRKYWKKKGIQFSKTRFICGL